MSRRMAGRASKTSVVQVGRYDLKLWMRDLKEGAAYLPK
jgi:hypothetical protein